jgi:hypothetical protein
MESFIFLKILFINSFVALFIIWSAANLGKLKAMRDYLVSQQKVASGNWKSKTGNGAESKRILQKRIRILTQILLLRIKIISIRISWKSIRNLQICKYIIIYKNIFEYGRKSIRILTRINSICGQISSNNKLIYMPINYYSILIHWMEVIKGIWSSKF